MSWVTRRQTAKGMLCSALLKGAGLKISSAQAKGKFYVPEEAEKHERTFMQWPVSRTVHPDAVFLEMLQQSIADIANTIVQFEPVVMLMDQSYEKEARRKLSDAVDVWHVPTDDLWARDSGPLFVIDGAGGIAIRHLNFNGWGHKQTHINDGAIASNVAEILNIPLYDNGLVGEPGGAETDGLGTLIAHESSWVIGNRNTKPKKEIEKLLLEAYGAQKIIWAPGVIGADITDYHIDSLARFVSPGKIVIQLPKTKTADPWSISAFETYEILSAATDHKGQPIELVIIDEPIDVMATSDDFVASYVNYYICNGAVIASKFGDVQADAKAAEKLQSLYPDREIITLSVDPLGEIGGGIHCATHQHPFV